MINLFAAVRPRYLGFFALAIIAAGIFSCTDFPSLDIIKEEGIAYRYCVIAKEGYCLKGPYSVCSKNGEPSNECPYENKVITLTYCVFDEDKLCLIGNFDSCPTGGVVSNGCPWINPVPEEDDEEFDYCVFAADSICLKGPYAYSFCPKSAELSNECPKDFEGKYVDLPTSSSSSSSSFFSSSSLSSSSQAESSSSLSLCGNSEYDPATETCLGGSTVTLALCGVHIYDLKTGFCPQIPNPSPYPRCGEIDNGEYDPHTQFCGTDNTVQEKVPCGNVQFDPTEQFCSGTTVLPLCNGSEYNILTEFCERNSGNTADSVYANCGGKSFAPAYQFCSANNIILPLCSGKKFTSTQFCDKNSDGTADSVYTKCGNSKQYDPTEQFCSVVTVLTLCGGKKYDPTKEFCVKDVVQKKCGGKEYDVDASACYISPDGNESVINSMTDIRDGMEYYVVSFGSQAWMAANMNIAKIGDTDIGKCYDEDNANCEKYGRLYTWAEAMALPDKCNTTPDDDCRYYLPRQGICPEGWHIPSDDEWSNLVKFVGGDATAGNVLKASNGWNSSGNGWDTKKFTALPGGYGESASFYDEEKYGFWWTASGSRTANNAFSYTMSYANHAVTQQDDSKARLYSVRCLLGDGGN